MRIDDHESFPTLLAGDAPYRFPIFEHLLDLCWSNTPKGSTPSASPPPECSLVALHSTLGETQAYFAHPSHTLDPPAARIAQVENEAESMVDVLKRLLRRDVKKVEEAGMHVSLAGKALVTHAQGVLQEGPSGRNVKEAGQGDKVNWREKGALTTEEMMVMLSFA